MSLHTGETVTSNMSFFLSLYCRKCQVKLHCITLMLCGVWAITHGSQRHDTRPFSKSLQPTALSVRSPKQLLFQWNVNLKNWFALVQPLTSNSQCVLLKKSGTCLVIATISGPRKNTLWHLPRGVFTNLHHGSLLDKVKIKANMTNQQSQVGFFVCLFFNSEFPTDTSIKNTFFLSVLASFWPHFPIQLCSSSRHGAPFIPAPPPHRPLSTIITLILCLGFLSSPLSTVLLFWSHCFPCFLSFHPSPLLFLYMVTLE